MQPYDQNYNYQGATNQANSNYNAATQMTQQRQNELAGYRQTMQNPADMYANSLGQAQSMYGFNPQDLIRAQHNLANTQTTLANLPQATQQQGNYYGVTAGGQANNYAQQAGNLNALLAGQANAAGMYRDVLGATQTQANQQAGFGLEGQKLQTQILQSILTNALGLQQEQGNQVGRSQTQQSNYGDYLNAQQQARAALMSAQAQQTQAGAQAAYNQQQTAQAAYNMQLQREYAQKQQQASAALGGPLRVTNNSGMQGSNVRLQ